MKGCAVTRPREEIIDEAKEIISGDRDASYGAPTQNFLNIAALWNVQFAHKLNEPLTATDVAFAMCHLKLARMIATPKRDNFADLIGYAANGWECEVASVDSASTSPPLHQIVHLEQVQMAEYFLSNTKQ